MRVYLFQPQHEITIKGTKNYWLPYASGCLWSYAKQQIPECELGEIVFKRESINKVLDRIKDPDVCAFSTYIWNEQYNLILAEEIKKRYPKCVIEFGGPQATRGLVDREYVDTVLLGEGEQAFTDLLNRIKNGYSIPPVYERLQLKNLSYASPYESGIFDDIVNQYPEYNWAALVETNRGCPHHCTFCDWGTWMNNIKKFDLDQVERDINWMSTHRVGFLMLADANFGIFAERDLKIAKMLRKAADHPDAIIDDLTVQYTKNATDVVFDISEALGPYDRRGVSMSVQSMNGPTLRAIKRQNNKKNAGFVKKARERNLNVYTELILGLPEETLESWKDGICQLLDCGQDSIDVWFCQVFGNTELNSNRDKYGIKVVNAEDYVSFTNKEDNIKEVVEIINKTNSMTTDEMIEAYLYSWMIIQLHINGYSEIISDYFNKEFGVSYRKFYDNIFDTLGKDYSSLGNHFRELKERVSSYLKNGKILSDKDTGHTLELSMGTDFEFFWSHKEVVINYIRNCCGMFIPDDIMELQRSYIYNPNIDYPQHVGEYLVDNARMEEERDDIWVLKRKNLLKNKITAL